MQKSSQEKVGISPDTERAPRADTEMKYPKTQDITRKNEAEQMHLLSIISCFAKDLKII